MYAETTRMAPAQRRLFSANGPGPGSQSVLPMRHVAGRSCAPRPAGLAHTNLYPAMSAQAVTSANRSRQFAWKPVAGALGKDGGARLKRPPPRKGKGIRLPSATDPGGRARHWRHIPAAKASGFRRIHDQRRTRRRPRDRGETQVANDLTDGTGARNAGVRITDPGTCPARCIG